MFGKSQIEIGDLEMPQDFIRVTREDMRLRLDWGTLLTKGYALMGQEETATAKANSLSTRLINSGFEIQYAPAYLAGNPRSRQPINGYRAVFAKPIDLEKTDPKLLSRFTKARAEQV